MQVHPVFGGILNPLLRVFGLSADESELSTINLGCTRLLYGIADRWGIPLDAAHVFGHYQINAKNDPGPALNLFWQRPGDGKEAVLP